MAFVVRTVAIRHSGKKRLQQTQRIVQPLFINGLIKQGHGGQPVGRTVVQIAWQEALHQAETHFLVGEVQGVELRDGGIPLDGDVTALVEQRGDVRHALCRGIERLRHGFPSSDLLR